MYTIKYKKEKLSPKFIFLLKIIAAISLIILFSTVSIIQLASTLLACIIFLGLPALAFRKMFQQMFSEQQISFIINDEKITKIEGTQETTILFKNIISLNLHGVEGPQPNTAVDFYYTKYNPSFGVLQIADNKKVQITIQLNFLSDEDLHTVLNTLLSHTESIKKDCPDFETFKKINDQKRTVPIEEITMDRINERTTNPLIALMSSRFFKELFLYFLVLILLLFLSLGFYSAYLNYLHTGTFN